MSVNDYDYTGAVGIVHFSDESISDPNCLCFATEGKAIDDEGNPTGADKWANLEFGNIFNYKSRIIQLDKDLSGLIKLHFCFASCNSLQKLFIHGKDSDGEYIKKPDDWDTQTFAKFVGSFDKVIHNYYVFRNITNVKTIELKFPELVRCAGDFCNCTSLETLNTNFSKCLIAEREFDNCPKLTTVTFDGGLNKLLYAPGTFANCPSLKKFNYGLPVLLSGKRMFYKCNLDTASAETILGSLPEIKLCRSTNNSVGNEALLNIIESKGWKKDKNGNWEGILKDIKRDKSTNYDRMIIYYKYPRYDYTTAQVDVIYNQTRVINYDDFGVLDLGVEVAADVKKSNKLQEAIAKGWKIYINNTLQDAFYYGKEGKITIKETTTVGGTSSRETIFTGTYSAYGARQKGKDGKLKIKISKTAGEADITLKTDVATIQPKSAANDDGSFNENETITLKFKNVERKIKVSSNKTTLSLKDGQSDGKYDVIFS